MIILESKKNHFECVGSYWVEYASDLFFDFYA